jgi:hypothetical protein
MNPVLAWSAVLLLLSAPSGQGVSVEKRFAQAQAEFDAAKALLADPDGDSILARKKFYDSAREFAAIADDGVPSANLYINTGNAFHFAGDDARALLWYLRANRLTNTAETRNGIIALRKACQTKPWPPELGSVGRALMFWHYDLGRPLKHWILLITYPLGTLMLLAAVFAERRYFLVRFGIVLMVIGATMGISDLVATAAGDGHWAVILENEKGYAGNGEGYSTVVERIPAGQEVKIIETRNDWTRVELPPGTRCWLPAAACEPV